jgi:sRNA-binding protein
MSETARIGAVIKLLCDRFPQTFSLHDPRPLKVGVHADVLAALGRAVEPRDLKSSLGAYTSNTRYLRALAAGAARTSLDGEPAGTVTPEDEAIAKTRLAESAKGVAAKVAPAAQTGAEGAASPTAGNQKPPAPKRLSLADLREAGRRRRGAAA